MRRNFVYREQLMTMGFSENGIFCYSNNLHELLLFYQLFSEYAHYQS